MTDRQPQTTDRFYVAAIQDVEIVVTVTRDALRDLESGLAEAVREHARAMIGRSGPLAIREMTEQERARHLAGHDWSSGQ